MHGLVLLLQNVSNDICSNNSAVQKSQNLIQQQEIAFLSYHNLMGMNVGPLRMPLCEMEEANKETLIKAMKDFGIKLA